MNELIPKFKDIVFSNIEDTMIDYGEIGLDSILNCFDIDILKEVPALKTIVSIYKTLSIVNERKLLKNTYIFIREFNSGNLNEIKKREYQYKINNNSELAEKELGRILILLNTFIDDQKIILLSKLFKTYINEVISWDEFCEFSEVINRLFLQDIDILLKIFSEEIKILRNNETFFRAERLNSIGLIMLNSKSKFSFGENILDEYNVCVNEFGRKFIQITLI